jgi:hypothetical protein
MLPMRGVPGIWSYTIVLCFPATDVLSGSTGHPELVEI